MVVLEAPITAGYVHSPSGFPRVVTLVALQGTLSPLSDTVAKKLAVQVCVSQPDSLASLLQEPFGAMGSSSQTVLQVLNHHKLTLLDYARLAVGSDHGADENEKI